MGRDDVLDLPPAEVAEILKLHYGVTADTIEVVSGEIATVCRVQRADPACSHSRRSPPRTTPPRPSSGGRPAP